MLAGVTDDYSENQTLAAHHMLVPKPQTSGALEEKRMDNNTNEDANAQVARLNADRGFGFLKMDTGKEMFFHARVLVDDIDIVQLKPGDRVFAIIGQSERGKGLEASKVIIKTPDAFKRQTRQENHQNNRFPSHKNTANVWPGDRERDRDHSPHTQPHFQYSASSGVVEKEGTVIEVDTRGISWIKTDPPHMMEQLFFAQEEFNGNWALLRIGEKVKFLHRPGNRQIREVTIKETYKSGGKTESDDENSDGKSDPEEEGIYVEHVPASYSHASFTRGRSSHRVASTSYRENPYCKGEIVRLTERGFGFAKILGTNEEVYFHAKHIKDGSEYREYKKGDFLIFRLSPSFDPNHSTTAIDIQDKNIYGEKAVAEGVVKEQEGVMRRLNPRGFGFISCQSNKDEIYFHAKNLQPPADFTALKIGDPMKYTRDLSDNKPGEFEAVNVQLLLVQTQT